MCENLEMIGNWQIAKHTEPMRYIEYAKAYLQASTDMCLRMKDNVSNRTWPNACVVMMLAAHSVELFLKGAILVKEPKADFVHHRLEALEVSYRVAYPNSEFRFDVPFKTEQLGMTETEIEALKKDYPLPSILFRYPVRKPGDEWEGFHGFDPQGFLCILDSLSEDYGRVLKKIGNI